MGKWMDWRKFFTLSEKEREIHLVLHGLGTDAKIKAQLPHWLRGIDDSPQIYCLYAGERETEAEYEEFLKDQRNH